MLLTTGEDFKNFLGSFQNTKKKKTTKNKKTKIKINT